MKKSRTVTGKKYYPIHEKLTITENAVSGNRWNARKRGNTYILEYDTGELVENFKEIKITEEDFYLIKEGKIDIRYLRNKYVFGE